MVCWILSMIMQIYMEGFMLGPSSTLLALFLAGTASLPFVKSSADSSSCSCSSPCQIFFFLKQNHLLNLLLCYSTFLGRRPFFWFYCLLNCMFIWCCLALHLLIFTAYFIQFLEQFLWIMFSRNQIMSSNLLLSSSACFKSNLLLWFQCLLGGLFLRAPCLFISTHFFILFLPWYLSSIFRKKITLLNLLLFGSTHFRSNLLLGFHCPPPGWHLSLKPSHYLRPAIRVEKSIRLLS